MPRKLRYVPPGGALVEVTCRTVQGRYLLKPTKILNQAIIGALGRAKRKYDVHICAAVYMANHYHLLLHVEDAKQLASFMSYVNAKVAREASRAWEWEGKIWGRRYDGIVVTDEEAAQVARLRYLLSHGVKENLVGHCREWPGVHCADAIITGRPIEGYWFDRSKESAAQKRGKRLGAYDFADRETLAFDPLPCWQHLDLTTYRKRIAEMVADVEAEARTARQRRGVRPLGVKAIRRLRAHARPKRIKKSAAPAFHAATRFARRSLKDAYRLFVAAYRAAADRLRAGEPHPNFPEGSFPPPMPFVVASAMSSS